MRFLTVLALHRNRKGRLNGVWKFLHRRETHAGTNLRIGADRRRKADSIQTVVDAHPDAASDLDHSFMKWLTSDGVKKPCAIVVP